MHRDMLRLHAGVPGRMTVLHLWLQVSIRNSRTTKDFTIRMYPKRHEMFWVSSKALSLGKTPKLESRGKGGESYGPDL